MDRAMEEAWMRHEWMEACKVAVAEGELSYMLYVRHVSVM